MKRNLGIIAAIVTLSGAMHTVEAAGPGNINALWVYKVSSLPNAVTDAPTRTTLMHNSATSGVNMLYVAVYSSTKEQRRTGICMTTTM
jgi:hypothetical protein